jgi:hypothetical protein
MLFHGPACDDKIRLPLSKIPCDLQFASGCRLKRTKTLDEIIGDPIG